MKFAPKSLAAVSALLLATGAQAALITVGAVSGSGTVVVANNAQNTPLSWNFDTSFAFSTTPLAQLGGATLAQVFGDAGQYRFQAASAGLNAVDGNGIGGVAQSQSTQQWQILNTVAGNNNSTYFGNPFTFAFSEDSVNAPTGSMNGNLTSDGFTHWYYGYDADTCFDPPGPAACTNGRTALANPMFDFAGRYTLTGFTDNGNNTRTLQVTLTGAITQNVPEPTSLALAGAALLAGVLATRRRKQLA